MAIFIGTSDADTLTGGAGDDIIEGLAGGDLLSGGEGADTLSYESDTIGVNIQLPFGAYGGDAQDDSIEGFEHLRGGLGADALGGNEFDNRIDGGGGADTLAGGVGEDTAVFASAGGAVTIIFGPFDPAVSFGKVLGPSGDPEGDDVANVVLIEFEHFEGSAFDDVIAGNPLDNSISGAEGADTLRGVGGQDTLVGGLGDDVYSIDDLATIIVEAAGEGRDRVLSPADHTLAANVEDLYLRGRALNGTGNDEDNRIFGNAQANELSGLDGNDTLSGAAGDTLRGGDGNDVYVVRDGSAVIEERAGHDVIRAYVTYTLPTAVETISLRGMGDIDATGNDAANQLIGNAGDNRLEGVDGNDTLAGGAGADTLVGGAGRDRLSGGLGADVFLFDTRGTLSDIVRDFESGVDQLAFLGASFGGLPAGSLAGQTTELGVARYIVSGNGMTTAEAGAWQFMIDGAGRLFFDADGSGGAAREYVALIQGDLPLAPDMIIA